MEAAGPIAGPDDRDITDLRERGCARTNNGAQQRAGKVADVRAGKTRLDGERHPCGAETVAQALGCHACI